LGNVVVPVCINYNTFLSSEIKSPEIIALHARKHLSIFESE